MNSPLNALVIGSHGAIGSALVDQLGSRYQVHTLSRETCDYTEQGLAQQYQALADFGSFQRIVCTIGVLQDDTGLSPEKNLRQVSASGLSRYFEINTILPMLCLKHFHALLPKDQPGVYASLSAMVGSIGDNSLGGWYGYRSSKAALNMLTKTSAIEIARARNQAAIITVHPGTTVSELSKPFSRNVAADKYYSPQESASRIGAVMDSVSAADTGNFYNWNGERLPW